MLSVKKFIDKLPKNEKSRVVSAIERLPNGLLSKPSETDEATAEIVKNALKGENASDVPVKADTEK